MMESFARRQTLWDEPMAASVANYMQVHPGQYMVVVAGGWHIEYGFGIPRRVHRRLPLPYVLVGGYNLEVPEAKRAQYMDIEMPGFPMRPVDYRVYQAYEVLEPAGVRLGVIMDDDEIQVGVKVIGVQADSVAEKIGIQADDRMLRFDNAEIENSFDLIYAVRNTRPGDSVSIELERDDETLQFKAYFEFPGNASSKALK
jgi:membrane-associated protease RseP (regulator of RpoE activity)